MANYGKKRTGFLSSFSVFQDSGDEGQGSFHPSLPAKRAFTLKLTFTFNPR